VSRAALVAALVVAVPLLAYPLLAIADRSPRFPTRAECAVVATGDAPNLDVVYGRFDDLTEAEAVLAEVTGAGFVGADLELDACGRWKVFYDPIDSFAQGDALASQVRGQGFEARVEVGE
jgi:hypothetical protein